MKRMAGGGVGHPRTGRERCACGQAHEKSGQPHYATAAALVFGALFFPAESGTAQQMLSYASFGLAFVARPVGAIVFGHFGDRVGRKSTLVASLMLMGGSTVAIAFLPTYDQVGWL